MLTATELGISQAEYEALQTVAAGLASGEYSHDDKTFDMNITCAPTDCGTVACIGGWVAMTMGKTSYEANLYVHRSYDGPLSPLYFPQDLPNWSCITPDVAAHTITTFLDSGEVDFGAHL